jgi:hypothetical protein
MRAASLTAGPSTVKSSRRGLPTFAVEKLADVQREMRVGHGQVSRGAPAVERRDTPALVRRGVERPDAGARRVVIGEDREHAVADELQHLPAVVLDRLHLRFGIIVQELEQGGGIDRIRNASEADEVAVPHDRGDGHRTSPHDVAFEHAPAGIESVLRRDGRAHYAFGGEQH